MEFSETFFYLTSNKVFKSQQCPKSNIPFGQCLKHFVSRYLVFWIILMWFNQFHNFSNSNVIYFYQVEKKPKKFHILIHTPLPPFLSCIGYARLKHHSDHKVRVLFNSDNCQLILPDQLGDRLLTSELNKTLTLHNTNGIVMMNVMDLTTSLSF